MPEFPPHSGNSGTGHKFDNMQIMNSRYYMGTTIAYQFTKGEMETIKEGLKKLRPSLLKKIEKIENHPKNEGQATYACRIDEIHAEIRFIDEMCELGNEYDPNYYTDKEINGYAEP